jgi:ABC-2 type transport system permease protein
MSGLGNIIKKEIKELLTPTTFLPIVLMALIFGLMGNSIQGIQEQQQAPPVIGVINEENSTFSTIATTVFYRYAKVVYNSSSIADKQVGLETVKQKDGVALIIIPQNFTERILSEHPGSIEVYWIMKGAGVMDTISSSLVEYLITTINTNI